MEICSVRLFKPGRIIAIRVDGLTHTAVFKWWCRDPADEEDYAVVSYYHGAGETIIIPIEQILNEIENRIGPKDRRTKKKSGLHWWNLQEKREEPKFPQKGEYFSVGRGCGVYKCVTSRKDYIEGELVQSGYSNSNLGTVYRYDRNDTLKPVYGLGANPPKPWTPEHGDNFYVKTAHHNDMSFCGDQFKVYAHGGNCVFAYRVKDPKETRKFSLCGEYIFSQTPICNHGTVSGIGYRRYCNCGHKHG